MPYNELNPKFGQRLKYLREEKKLTQQDLADELEIGRASISNYELGIRIPDIDVLVKIASYFRVTTDYLTGRSAFETFDDEYNLRQFDLLENIKSAPQESINLFNDILKILLDIIKETDISNHPEAMELLKNIYFRIFIVINAYFSNSRPSKTKGKEIIDNEEDLLKIINQYSSLPIKLEYRIAPLINELSQLYIEKYFTNDYIIAFKEENPEKGDTDA